MIPWLPFAASVAVYAVAPSVVSKPAPVAILALWVAWRGEGSPARLLAAALAVDAVADGVIERTFLGGLAVFLVGHLLKIAAFTADRPALAPARAAPFAAIAVGVGAVVVPTAGALGVPVAVYAVAIAAMAWRAAARVDGTPIRWLGMAGVALFLVSDTLLAANRFVVPLPHADLWILSTYWGAQALIARSAVP
ncbi:MAG: lysoplasmalogenase family protein [Myxococcota bacterium]